MGLLEEVYGNEIIEEQPPQEYSEFKAEKGYGWANAFPARQGLYNPELEKDACGVGFAA
jgi:glutamate synthase (NADPH/NADH)